MVRLRLGTRCFWVHVFQIELHHATAAFKHQLTSFFALKQREAFSIQARCASE